MVADLGSRRILIVGMTENPGGVESVIINHFRRFSKKGIHADFLTYVEHVSYEDEIRQAGSRIFVMKSRRQAPLTFRRDLRKFFTQHQGEWDTLWMNACNLSNIDFLSMAAEAGIDRRIIHCHNSRPMDHDVLRAVLHKVHQKTVLKYATECWSCSNAASSWFYGPGIFDDSRYRYVPNSVDPREYRFDEQIRKKKRLELGIAPNEIVLGNVGRLHMQKNQVLLLRAFRKLIDMNASDVRYRVLLIGDGEDRKMLERTAGELGIRSSIDFLGRRADVSELYQVLDIFAMPSLFEGVSIALLEAQSNGLPCLIADTLSDEGLVNDNIKKLPISPTEKIADVPEAWAIAISNLGPHPERTRSIKIVGSAYDITEHDSLFSVEK